MLDPLLPASGIQTIIANGGTQVSPTSTTTYTPASVTLTAGFWFLVGRLRISYATAPTISVIQLGFGTSSASLGYFNITPFSLTTGLALNAASGPSLQVVSYIYVPATTTQVLFGGAVLTYTGGASVNLLFDVTAINYTSGSGLQQ